MLEYEVLEKDPEGFEKGKKVKFDKEIKLEEETIKEAIIAEGTGGIGRVKTGLFLYKQYEAGESNEKNWLLEFEALNEKLLLIKLADLSKNREVQIK